MSEPIAKVGMRPSHPGEFIRAEILHELNLPVTRAAEVLRVRRAALSDVVDGKALSPEMALGAAALRWACFLIATVHCDQRPAEFMCWLLVINQLAFCLSS